MSLVADVFVSDGEDLVVREVHASGGRFLEIATDDLSPAGEDVTARAVLDAREVRALIQAAEEWLSTLGFAT